MKKYPTEEKLKKLKGIVIRAYNHDKFTFQDKELI